MIQFWNLPCQMGKAQVFHDEWNVIVEKAKSQIAYAHNVLQWSKLSKRNPHINFTDETGNVIFFFLKNVVLFFSFKNIDFSFFPFDTFFPRPFSQNPYLHSNPFERSFSTYTLWW